MIGALTFLVGLWANWSRGICLVALGGMILTELYKWYGWYYPAFHPERSMALAIEHSTSAFYSGMGLSLLVPLVYWVYQPKWMKMRSEQEVL